MNLITFTDKFSGSEVTPENMNEIKKVVNRTNSYQGRSYPPTVVADFGVLADYNEDFSTLTLVDTPAGGPDRVKSNSGHSLRLTGCNGVNSWAHKNAVFSAGCKTDRVTLWLFVEDYTKFSGGSVILFLGTDMTYAAHYYGSIVLKPYNGWQSHTFSASTLTVGAGSPTLDTITALKVRVNNQGHECSIIFDRVTFGGGGDSYVSLLCDDGDITGFTKVFPLLNKYGLVGNFSIIESLIGTAGYMTEDHLKMIADAGHRLIVHGQKSLATLGSLANAYADIEANRAYLDGLGVDVDSDVYVYPNGTYQFVAGSMEIPAYLAANGFVGAFTTPDSNYVTNDSKKQFICPRMAINATTVADTLLSSLDSYSAFGGSVALMVHLVKDSGATGQETNTAVLDTILAGLRERQRDGKIKVVTAKDFIDLAFV